MNDENTHKTDQECEEETARNEVHIIGQLRNALLVLPDVDALYHRYDVATQCIKATTRYFPLVCIILVIGVIAFAGAIYERTAAGYTGGTILLLLGIGITLFYRMRMSQLKSARDTLSHDLGRIVSDTDLPSLLATVPVENWVTGDVAVIVDMMASQRLSLEEALKSVSARPHSDTQRADYRRLLTPLV